MASVVEEGTLYAPRDDVRTFCILIATNYSGKEIIANIEPPEFVLGETNTAPEFLIKFPLGKVPAFETSEGRALFGPITIASYLSSPTLLGADASKLDQAYIQQFVELSQNEVMPACCNWVYPTLGISQQNKSLVESAKETVKSVLGFLNKHLSTRTFLVGERVSLADICLVTSLYLLYKQVLEPNFREPYENTNRWFITCINQPQFKSVVGEFVLCEKMAQFDHKKYQDLHKKETAPSKKDNTAKSKQQTQEAKKEISAEPELDEHEMIILQEPKFVDPYKNFPPTELIMDDFKKLYSNESKEEVAMPYFFEKYNPDDHSIWYCNYHYNHELSLPFMAENLIEGFFQRIEKLRKTAFGIICVLIDDNDKAKEISGVWVFRGPQKAFDLAEDWNIDAPTYDFRKLDMKIEDDKRLFCDYALYNTETKVQDYTIHSIRVFK